MANLVELLLRARDEISPKIPQMRANIDRGFAGVGTGIGGQFAGVASGIGLVTGAIGLFKGAIEDAMKPQTAMIAQAGDLAQLMVVPFSKAKEVLQDMRGELAKTAAALPGETSDYTSLMGTLSATVAKGSGGDITKYKTDLLESSKLFGLLAATKNIRGEQASIAATSLLSGSIGFDQFQKRYSLGRRNIISTYAQMQAKADGIDLKDWTKFDQSVRNAFITRLSKRAATDETLKAFDGTLESQFQSIKSSIFDPDFGLFGLLRRVAGAGKRSGIEAIGEALGAYTTLFGKIAKATGLVNIDPMVYIINFFDWLRGLAYTASIIMDGGANPLFEISNNLFEGVVKWFNGLRNSLSTNLDSIQWGNIGFAIGKMFGQLFVAVQSIDYGAFFVILAKLLYGLSKAIVWAFIGAVSEVIKPVGEKLQMLWSGILWVFDLIWKGLKGVYQFFEDIFTATGLNLAFNVLADAITVVNNSLGDLAGVLGKVTGVVSAPLANTVGKIQGGNLTEKVQAIGGLNPMNIGQSLTNWGASILGRSIMGVDSKEDMRIQPAIVQPRSTLPDINKPNKTNNNTFAPSIQVTAMNSDVEGLADRLMVRINEKYLEYQQGALV